MRPCPCGIQPREFRDAAHRTSRRIGEVRAEQGVPLDAVLHAFRMGGAMVWQDLVDETACRHPEDIRLLVHVAADVWNFVASTAVSSAVESS